MRPLRQKTGMPQKCPQPPGKTEDPKLLSFPFLCNDDGKQHSKDFFEKYFADSDGAYSTLDEEREEFGTDAQWTIITRRDFDLFAGTVETLQKAIDSADSYAQDSDSYLI